jgi:class 3 adenylate cyclase
MKQEYEWPRACAAIRDAQSLHLELIHHVTIRAGRRNTAASPANSHAAIGTDSLVLRWGEARKRFPVVARRLETQFPGNFSVGYLIAVLLPPLGMSWLTVLCTLHVEMDDGVSLEIGANSLFEMPPGHDAWVVGDEPWVTIDFAGMRSFARPLAAHAERVLASLLFTDIVDSTATAVRLGDAAWRELLAQHNETTRFAIDYYRGREMATTGDGFLEIFDSAGRAVETAAMICERAVALGLDVRAGIHTGEVQLVPGNVRGVAVHAAARIMAVAGPREVLVSATTRDLLAGSNLRFEPRGRHEMKGLPEPIELYALVFGP